jgi:polyphosphate kinase
MRRNLDRRVEVLTPVRDPSLKARLDEVIDTLLADDVLAWELGPDAVWRRVRGGRGVNAQSELADLARRRSRQMVAIGRPD